MMVKKFLRETFTKSRLKKFAAVLVLGAFCAGGGAIYFHQQKSAKKLAEAQARTAIIANQAKEKNIALLSTDDARALTAKIIGVEENAIAYKEISLRVPGKKHKKIAGDENFQPVYKISCRTNNVKYKIYIDAVSGDVMSVDVG